MWYAILACATGIACGLPGPQTSHNPHRTEAECLEIGNGALRSIVDEDAIDKFVVTCVLKVDL